MCRVLVAFAILALLAAGRAAEAAHPVNCDPEQGMGDLDRCPQPQPPHDPFADGKLTCWEMKQYRDKIFAHEIDWPTQVHIDWSCRENLASFSFLRRLDELTKTIRSDGSSRCTGSIVRHLWFSYSFSLLE